MRYNVTVKQEIYFNVSVVADNERSAWDKAEELADAIGVSSLDVNIAQTDTKIESIKELV